MNTSEAEKFLMAQLRGACARASADHIKGELAALDRAEAPAATADSLLRQFVQALERHGASAACVANRSAAIAEVARYVASRHARRRIVTGHDPRLAALPWRDGGLLPRFGPAESGEAVAVSYARDGIAETGSVVVWLDRNNPARNNLLPEDQVVLLDRNDLHQHSEALWRHAALKKAGHGPRGLMMISGPSSTADIGMQLVKGAHGPRALHVIIVGGDAQEPGPPQY